MGSRCDPRMLPRSRHSRFFLCLWYAAGQRGERYSRERQVMQNGTLPVAAVANSEFNGLGLDARLLRAVNDLAFTRPTPVQADTIPLALAGRDVLATAMTG